MRTLRYLILHKDTSGFWWLFGIYRPTFFIHLTHGWNNTRKVGCYRDAQSLVLKKFDFEFVVGWKG